MIIFNTLYLTEPICDIYVYNANVLACYVSNVDIVWFYILRPQFFIFRFTDFFTVMSNIEGGMFYCHVKHRRGEKEGREMKGERG